MPGHVGRRRARPQPREPGSGPQTFRRIAGFFRPYRGRLLVIAAAILVSATIGVVNPILIKLVIDNLLGPRDLRLLYLQSGLMIVLPIISGLSASGSRTCPTWSGSGS